MRMIIAHEQAVAAVRIVLALAEMANERRGKPFLRIDRPMMDQIECLADEIKATEGTANDGS